MKIRVNHSTPNHYGKMKSYDFFFNEEYSHDGIAPVRGDHAIVRGEGGVLQIVQIEEIVTNDRASNPKKEALFHIPALVVEGRTERIARVNAARSKLREMLAGDPDSEMRQFEELAKRNLDAKRLLMVLLENR